MSDSLALINGIVVSCGCVYYNQVIVISDGVICNVSDISAVDTQNMTVIDLKGHTVSSGLIDLQIYGSGGLLFGGKPEVCALAQLERDLITQGTTGFLAAIATNTMDVVNAGIGSAKEYRNNTSRIGNFWGLHLEGPYLSPAKRGAHPAELIQQATLNEAQDLLDRSCDTIRMMTIAPERVDQDVQELFSANGIVLSAGHTAASYSVGKSCLAESGPVTAVTHLYNAMPPMLHREPSLGIIPAIFEERPFTSIVVDGIHVDYVMVRLAKRELGEKLFLITDAVTNTLEGVYPHILQDDEGGRRYVMPDGTLSGSALTLLTAVRNCVTHCNISLPEAINMASLYPAQVLGLQESKGKVEPGYDADLCVFDSNYQCVATFIKGKQVFSAL